MGWYKAELGRNAGSAPNGLVDSPAEDAAQDGGSDRKLRNTSGVPGLTVEQAGVGGGRRVWKRSTPPSRVWCGIGDRCGAWEE